VLGQPDASAALANRGLAAPTARSMSFPVALRVIGGALYVADSGNNRVLRFARPPVTGEDLEADLALGQASLTERQSAVQVDERERLAGPVALDDDGVNLFVLDRDLARIARYSLQSVSAIASSVIRLGDLGPPLARRPSGLVVERGPFFTTSLLVSDTANDRVLRASPSARSE
jgi:hypothetical protein